MIDRGKEKVAECIFCCVGGKKVGVHGTRWGRAKQNYVAELCIDLRCVVSDEELRRNDISLRGLILERIICQFEYTLKALKHARAIS